MNRFNFLIACAVSSIYVGGCASDKSPSNSESSGGQTTAAGSSGGHSAGVTSSNGAAGAAGAAVGGSSFGAAAGLAGGVEAGGGAFAGGSSYAGSGGASAGSAAMSGAAGIPTAGTGPGQVSVPVGPSTDQHWSDGLSKGANGPIPVIVVDQFGYRPDSKKVAIIRDPRTGYDRAVDFTPGPSYALVDTKSGQAIKRGAPVPWNGGKVDTVSGDVAFWFDFSDVKVPGTYYVLDEQNGKRSPEFVISADVYRGVLKQAVRMLFYQRAGQVKTAANAGTDWADGASQLGPNQDPQAHSWLDKTNNAKVRDIRGGWFDAGDQHKYTNWQARDVVSLLSVYEHHPTAFGDDYNIPESGNGTPDILDEIKWSVDWIARMQSADGSELCLNTVSAGSPPSSATGPSYYGPPTTSATLSAASAFAYAARVFGARSEPALVSYAAALKTRAINAWKFAVANPNLIYHNNNEALQPGSANFGGGDQEVDDATRLSYKVDASAYLFALNNDATYSTFFDQNYARTLPYGGYSAEHQEALLFYSALPNATSSVKQDIQSKFLASLQNVPQFLPGARAQVDPYRAPVDAFNWGSTALFSLTGRELALAADYHLDSTIATPSVSAAEEYLHYLHGANPFSLVYLSNMKQAGAEHSVETMFSLWFTDDSKWGRVTATTPGPAPGYLAGGPNSSYAIDKCCTDGTKCGGGGTAYQLCSTNLEPPLNQPAAKSYLQVANGWPLDAYQMTEPSDSYQTNYIRLLGDFVP